MPKKRETRHKGHRKQSHKKRCESTVKSDSSSSCSLSLSSSSSTIPPIVSKNYIFAYNTAGFTYPNNTDFSILPFDVVGASEGWTMNTVSGASYFTCPKTAVYQITYTASVRNRGSINADGQFVIAVKEDICFRLLRNSQSIPGSNSWATVNVSDTLESGYLNGPNPSEANVKATFQEIGNTILVSLNAGDVISLISAGTIFGSVSTLTLDTVIRLLLLSGLEPLKLAIVEVA